MIEGKANIETVKKVRAAMSLLGFNTCPFILPSISHDPDLSKNEGSCSMLTRDITVNTNTVSKFTMFHELTHSQQEYDADSDSGYYQHDGSVDRKKYRDDIYEQQANIVAGLLTGIVSVRELFFVFYITKNKDDFLYIAQNIVLQKQIGLPALDSNLCGRNIKRLLTRAGRIRYKTFLKEQFQEGLCRLKNNQL
ncbi:MAG: hypothetical protein LWW94_09930 [Candidatus Desulfofervidaceae bacterium]|nr:hypothetical protein [Candidatus Desulfofervidaceae bacterium]